MNKEVEEMKSKAQDLICKSVLNVTAEKQKEINEIRKQTAKEIFNNLLLMLNSKISESYNKAVEGNRFYGGQNFAYHNVRKHIKTLATFYGFENKDKLESNDKPENEEEEQLQWWQK